MKEHEHFFHVHAHLIIRWLIRICTSTVALFVFKIKSLASTDCYKSGD